MGSGTKYIAKAIFIDDIGGSLLKTGRVGREVDHETLAGISDERSCCHLWKL